MKQKVLTYWIADCIDDSACYSLRSKTLTGVRATLAVRPDVERFRAPRKVEINYVDAFDLVRQVLGEGGAE